MALRRMHFSWVLGLALTVSACGWVGDDGTLDMVLIGTPEDMYAKALPLPDAAQELRSVRPGEVVHLEGFLVDVKRDDGWHWNTSLTREDTGAGACEIVLVETIRDVR